MGIDIEFNFKPNNFVEHTKESMIGEVIDYNKKLPPRIPPSLQPIKVLLFLCLIVIFYFEIIFPKLKEADFKNGQPN